jgi:hypothetical protein
MTAPMMSETASLIERVNTFPFPDARARCLWRRWLLLRRKAMPPKQTAEPQTISSFGGSSGGVDYSLEASPRFRAPATDIDAATDKAIPQTQARLGETLPSCPRCGSFYIHPVSTGRVECQSCGEITGPIQ